MSFTVHSFNLNQFLLWIPSTICVKKKKKKKKEKEAIFTSGDSRLTQKGDFALSASLKAGAPNFKTHFSKKLATWSHNKVTNQRESCLRWNEEF